jgi:hypothetical protein
MLRLKVKLMVGETIISTAYVEMTPMDPDILLNPENPHPLLREALFAVQDSLIRNWEGKKADEKIIQNSIPTA